MSGQHKPARGGGWGPFSGRQLTTIVCVAVVATVAVPTAAFAATGSFTSSTATPAVSALNSSTAANATGVHGRVAATGNAARTGVDGSATGANSVGVKGTGTKYGVYSAGNLGVASGKSLTCSGCVNVADLSNAARGIQVLPSGASESGMFSAAAGHGTGGGYLGAGITYPRPLATPIEDDHIVGVTGAGPVSHCPGPGHAEKGYLCLYNVEYDGVAPGYGYSQGFSSPSVGAVLYWSVTGQYPYAGGEYTVTAP